MTGIKTEIGKLKEDIFNELKRQALEGTVGSIKVLSLEPSEIKLALDVLSEKILKRLLAEREGLEKEIEKWRNTSKFSESLNSKLKEKDRCIKELEKTQCDESCRTWFRERNGYKKRIAGLEGKLKDAEHHMAKISFELNKAITVGKEAVKEQAEGIIKKWCQQEQHEKLVNDKVCVNCYRLIETFRKKEKEPVKG